jgi:hypothetical protein
MRPRRIAINPVAVAIEGAARLSRTEVEQMRAAYHRDLASFCAGHHCEGAWSSMAAALNMAESLSNVGIGSDDESVLRINRGQQVLKAALERHNERGSWALRFDEEANAHERTLLQDALWMHITQLELCSYSEYRRALQATERRVAAALAGQPGKGVTVVELTPRSAA